LPQAAAGRCRSEGREDRLHDDAERSATSAAATLHGRRKSRFALKGNTPSMRPMPSPDRIGLDGDGARARRSTLVGRSGGRSEKWLVRQDGSREALPSKVDGVPVQAGDRAVFRTAGGGWGDPLERDPHAVRADGACGLVSAEAARNKRGLSRMALT
jgi:hypothetical protein